MNDQFISKELALWLKERGCKIKPTHNGNWYLFPLTGEWVLDQLAWDDDLKPIIAYSWYDILVTHAKEFWGGVEQGDKGKTVVLLYFLQNNDLEKAEAYVREHSLFANS